MIPPLTDSDREAILKGGLFDAITIFRHYCPVGLVMAKQAVESIRRGTARLEDFLGDAAVSKARCPSCEGTGFVPHPGRKWTVWAHDPCPEGGWHVRGTYDTPDEAVEAAKKLHAEEIKRHEEMVEFCKEDSTRKHPWTWGSECYDGCIVTSDEVFRLSAPKDGEAKKGEG